MINTTEIPQVALDCLNDDHLAVANLVNELMTSLQAESDSVHIGAQFGNLLEHCENHFHCEEYQMQKYHYDALEEHRDIHVRALAELREVQKVWTEKQDVMQLRNYIAGQFTPWLIDHIDVHDKKAAQAIVDAGGS